MSQENRSNRKKAVDFVSEKERSRKKRKAEALKFERTSECPLLWVGK